MPAPRYTQVRAGYVNEDNTVTCWAHHWGEDWVDASEHVWDTPQHCDLCGALLNVPLTADGLAYVADYVTQEIEFSPSGTLTPWTAVAAWADLYPGFAEYMPKGYNPTTRTLD